MSALPIRRDDGFVRKTAAFAAIHARVPTSPFIDNVHAGVDTVEAGDLHLPVTVNDPAHENAWVCSPITTYGRYAREEARRVVPGLLAPAAGALVSIVDGVLRRADLDRAVSIDNWFLSTNLHPPVAAVDVARVVETCADRWPGHAVWVRSLNRCHHADWLEALAGAGFDLVPTRQVYLFDAPSDGARLRGDLRRDLKRVRAASSMAVHHGAFTAADLDRSAVLYAQLYMDKYSSLNPRYTPAFLAAWHRAGLLEMSGFRDGAGELQAVVGLFRVGAIVTAPIVGYNTALPRSAALYRLLMARVFETTLARGLQLNLSAGAPDFKRLRGCRPEIEYSAVWSRHLPARTRRTIALLSWLTTRVGVPLMRRYAL